MFIGHFAVALVARPVAPRVSLGTLFVAAQLLDLLWPTFLLLGLESVSIVPGATRVVPLEFDHYPFSHSLLAVLLWASLAAGGCLLLRHSRTDAFVLGALVLSHWLLDAIVHRPDLPLFPGSEILVGLNVWSSMPLTIALEVSLFALGAGVYFRSTQPTGACVSASCVLVGTRHGEPSGSGGSARPEFALARKRSAGCAEGGRSFSAARWQAHRHPRRGLRSC